MKQSLGRFIFEFVLLFLAITAGFFVENLRENWSEKRQERELIKTMVQDLEIDIQSLDSAITLRGNRIAMLDSLTLLINSSEANQWTHRLYIFGRKVTRILDFSFLSTDRTFEQLKNANGFRLIENQKVAVRISKYYEQVNQIKQLQGVENDFTKIYLPISYRIFDGLAFDRIVDKKGRVTSFSANENPQLLKGYENHLNDFNGNLNNIKSVNKYVKDSETKLITQAQKLIEFIKKEYQLD
ncbi:MAG TPA: hypothetical protein VL728_08690 [Cyclobacteriaceae bacterium]|nr:hypothetical protein [Cyclobacteriaceae bacterium]